MKKATTTNEKFIEIDGKIKLIHQKIHTIETNHLKHMQRDIDRILYLICAVGVAVVSQFLYIISK
jgi:hypothetical protein